jgi:hypothetical protein
MASTSSESPPTFRELSEHYNNHFNRSAYSSWEYARVIQESVLCEGEDWRLFLETSHDKRLRWSAKLQEKYKDRANAIGEDELQLIVKRNNGDCTVFAKRVVDEMSTGLFTYMGDGEHTLAYTHVDSMILIVDGMFKKAIKYEEDNEDIWPQVGKLTVKPNNEPGKYYPERPEGLLLRGISNPSTMKVSRIQKSSPEADYKRADESFVALGGWQDAIRQSIFFWTMRGQLVIAFRTTLDQGPGLDGRIDFFAGKRAIWFRSQKMDNGELIETKLIFKFGRRNFFFRLLDRLKSWVLGIEEKEPSDDLFFLYLDQFLNAEGKGSRHEQFEHSQDCFIGIFEKMKELWGPPAGPEIQRIKIADKQRLLKSRWLVSWFRACFSQEVTL